MKYELAINLKTAKALGLERAGNIARPRRRGDRMISAASSSCCSAARRTWPLAAHAQQGERVRRIGVLMGPSC